MKNPKSILITGASSGIGQALAVEYANEGIILFLSGRNANRLEDVKNLCQANGAKAYTKIIDVSDEEGMAQWISECDAIQPLDLVIANAGISGSMGKKEGLAAHTKEIFKTNVDGVFNTIHPTLPFMRERQKGQIALVSSMAGYHGMPSAPAYSTSKVTVKAYGEALRGLYHDQGLEVNVICPGFVRSRMTDQNKFHMPFFMEAERAAKIIKRDLGKNKAHIAFPWQTKMLLSLMVRLLPESLIGRILRSTPSK
ncbi:MAG: SDR family NAD(P)-dependent oxidoreductase [Kordiimonadaceae bacterium]|jgi:short-subunit dehydrogenase|nr:SDR family NAD(P)-dependent oxidoreductase [Kordiimonadaceae bacterium]MBT6032084.1 SDR family NAD(P)-dependent oxidoreductase [Kordiimonadaceae bacterium]